MSVRDPDSDSVQELDTRTIGKRRDQDQARPPVPILKVALTEPLRRSQSMILFDPGNMGV